MVKTLIVTHGGLAQELLRSAETIAGGAVPHVTALSLDWTDGVDEARAKIGRAIEALAPNDGVLLLTDMYGGTPFNVAAGLARQHRVELVAGVNLPMVLRLECLGAPDLGVADLARWIQAKGRGSIRRGVPRLAAPADPCGEPVE